VAREEDRHHLAALSPLVNHLVDSAVERRERSPQPDIGWRGDPLRNLHDTADGPVRGTQRDRQGLADTVRLLGDVGAQERLADDPQGEPHHLRCQIGLRNIGSVPAVAQLRCGPGHRLGKRCNTCAVERRLSDPSLSKPGVALVGQQAVREKRPEDSEDRGLLVVVQGVVLEDMSHVVKVRQQHDMSVDHPEVDDLAVVTCRVDQQPKSVALNLRQGAERSDGRRAWRKRVSHR